MFVCMYMYVCIERVHLVISNLCMSSIAHSFKIMCLDLKWNSCKPILYTNSLNCTFSCTCVHTHTRNMHTRRTHLHWHIYTDTVIMPTSLQSMSACISLSLSIYVILPTYVPQSVMQYIELHSHHHLSIGHNHMCCTCTTCLDSPHTACISWSYIQYCAWYFRLTHKYDAICTVRARVQDMNSWFTGLVWSRCIYKGWLHSLWLSSYIVGLYIL